MKRVTFIAATILVMVSTAPAMSQVLRCAIFSMLYCNSSFGGCDATPRPYHYVLDIAGEAFFRCSLTECDRFDATYTPRNSRIEIDVDGSRPTMVAELSYGVNLSVAALSSGAAYLSFGACKPASTSP